MELIGQKTRLARADVLQGDEGLIGLLVVDHGMAVEEGAALAVLTGQPHREALIDQARIGQGLGESPVHGELAVGHLAALLDDAGDGPVQLEMPRVPR